MTVPQRDLSGLSIDRDRPPPASRRALWRNVILASAALAVVVVALYALRRPRGIQVTVVTPQIVGASGAGAVGVTANGYVVARTQASVSSRISGRLEYLGVEEGSVVRRGEVIARLENTDFRAQVTQAEADLVRARAALEEARTDRTRTEQDLRRGRTLLDRGFETRENVEHLTAELGGAEARVRVREAEVNVARAAVDASRATLEYTFIRAPFDGTVLRKDAEVGEVVAPVATGSGLTRGAVVTMADLATLEVEVDVNEAYISRVRAGQKSRIVLDAYPDTSFAGAVRQIVPTADRQRATVQVKVSILEHDPRILPEMGARVEFIEGASGGTTAGPRVISVPAEAVRDEAGQSVVWVVREGHAHRTPVDAAPVSGGRRAVRSGLTGAEQIVLTSAGGLEDGAPVRIVERRKEG